MLYIEGPKGTFTYWSGQPIDGVVHPTSIETLWSKKDLEAAGLYTPITPPVPEGKNVVSFTVCRVEGVVVTVARVNGVVTKVYVLEDAPPEPLPNLQPYQFFAMLELSGFKSALDAFVEGLPSPQNVIARAKLDRTLVFRRDNDLVLAAQQTLGLTDKQLDALWLQASAIE
jgi:hypothetical protein